MTVFLDSTPVMHVLAPMHTAAQGNRTCRLQWLKLYMIVHVACSGSNCTCVQKARHRHT